MIGPITKVFCYRHAFWALCLCYGLQLGCASMKGKFGVAPSKKYRQAISARAQGDSQAYYDGLLDLASNHSDTRAGRRARAILMSSEITLPLVTLGALQGGPFTSIGTKQNEEIKKAIPAELNRLFLAQHRFRKRMGRYCQTFNECGWTSEEQTTVVYLMGPKSVVGGGGAQAPKGLRLQALSILSALGVFPAASADEFLAVGVGNADGDSQLEVWTIDHKGNLLHLLSD